MLTGEIFVPKTYLNKKILCHSFLISVIPSVLVSFLLNLVIPFELLPFQKNFILYSSGSLPYPKGEKIGWQSRPYLQVSVKIGVK
jgi:hypothetical protein